MASDCLLTVRVLCAVLGICAGTAIASLGEGRLNALGEDHS